MLKKLIKWMRRRILRWHLQQIPNAIPVKSVNTVGLCLMADTGETWLAQTDWFITGKDFSALKNAKCLLLSVRVWEDGDISSCQYARAHLLPDKRRCQLPNKFVLQDSAK